MTGIARVIQAMAEETTRASIDAAAQIAAIRETLFAAGIADRETFDALVARCRATIDQIVAEVKADARKANQEKPG